MHKHRKLDDKVVADKDQLIYSTIIDDSPEQHTRRSDGSKEDR